MSGRRWRVAAPHSDICSPPGLPSPPEMHQHTTISRGRTLPYETMFVLLNSKIIRCKYLDYVPEVFPLNMVVSLDKDFSEDGFSNGVVFGVEFIKAMKCVTVLQERGNIFNI